MHSAAFLQLDKALASKVVIVIMSMSDGRKCFWSQLNNSKRYEIDHVSMGSQLESMGELSNGPISDPHVKCRHILVPIGWLWDDTINNHESFTSPCNVMRWCIAVAKLSEALAREALVLSLATAHTGMFRLSQLHEHRFSKWVAALLLGAAKVKRRRRGDEPHRHKAVLTEKWWT